MQVCSRGPPTLAAHASLQLLLPNPQVLDMNPDGVFFSNGPVSACPAVHAAAAPVWALPPAATHPACAACLPPLLRVPYPPLPFHTLTLPSHSAPPCSGPAGRPERCALRG